jgi:hypothetical protein
MQLNLIESDIQNRENALRRCKSNLDYLYNSIETEESKKAIKLLEQESFYLQDQLDRYYVLAAILREEQSSYDEMLQTV